VNGRSISGCNTEDVLEAAEEAFDREDYDRAEHLAAYIRENDPGSPDVARALYLAGESSFKLDDYWQSFQYFKELRVRFRGSKDLGKVKDRFYDIGMAYLDSEPWFLFGHLFTGQSRGVSVLIYLITHYSHYQREGDEMADDALMAVVDYHFEEEEYFDAIDFSKQLIAEYPDSEWKHKAVYRLGMSHVSLSKGPSYDRESLLQALYDFDYYLMLYPFGRYAKEVSEALTGTREDLAEKELEIARFYLDLDNGFGARIHLANAVLRFSDTPAGVHAREIMLEKGWDYTIHSSDRLVPRRPTGLKE